MPTKFEPILGDEFPASWKLQLLGVAFGLVAIAIGIALFSVHDWVAANIGRKIALIFPACSTVCGIVAILLCGREFIKGEWLVIGQNSFQVRTGKSSVSMQIPYVNIEKIALETKKIEGTTHKYIGIALRSAEDQQTLIGSSTFRDHIREKYGFDAIIENRFQVPLEDLDHKLQDHWSAKCDG